MIQGGRLRPSGPERPDGPVDLQAARSTRCRPRRDSTISYGLWPPNIGQGGHIGMALNRFEVRIDPSGYIQLRVNGTGLIDLVREVELPYAQLEFDTRIAAGDTPDEIGQRGSLAGDYLY